MCDEGSEKGREKEARTCQGKKDACLGEEIGLHSSLIFPGLSHDSLVFKCNSNRCFARTKYAFHRYLFLNCAVLVHPIPS